MKRSALAAIGCLIVLAGCSSDGDDGIDHDAVTKLQQPLVSAAQKAGGDWNKLSDADKKLFLDRARGNEGAAKQMVGFMGGKAPTSGPSGPVKP